MESAAAGLQTVQQGWRMERALLWCYKVNRSLQPAAPCGRCADREGSDLCQLLMQPDRMLHHLLVDLDGIGLLLVRKQRSMEEHGGALVWCDKATHSLHAPWVSMWVGRARSAYKKGANMCPVLMHPGCLMSRGAACACDVTG